jgi:hypothetical protein
MESHLAKATREDAPAPAHEPDPTPEIPRQMAACARCGHSRPNPIKPPGGMGGCAIAAPESLRVGRLWPWPDAEVACPGLQMDSGTPGLIVGRSGSKLATPPRLSGNHMACIKMNLAVHGLEGDIREANTFYEDVHHLKEGKPSWGNCNFVMAKAGRW